MTKSPTPTKQSKSKNKQVWKYVCDNCGGRARYKCEQCGCYACGKCEDYPVGVFSECPYCEPPMLHKIKNTKL